MGLIRTHYLDASAIVMLFVEEPGSDKLRAYIGPHATRHTTSLCLAESLGVLKAKYKHHHITHERYLACCEELMAFLREGSLVVEDVQLSTRAIFDQAEDLCRKYAMDFSDACQLLTLRTGLLSKLEGESSPTLVTADQKLAQAAKREGLKAWDCVHDPLLTRQSTRMSSRQVFVWPRSRRSFLRWAA